VIAASHRGQEQLNTEAEESTALEVVTRQQVKTHRLRRFSAYCKEVYGVRISKRAVVVVVTISVFGKFDRLCGLVVRVLGYRSGGPGSFPGTTRIKNVVGLERGPLSFVSTTEELLDRKIAAPV
jgi:hypothetical protein